MGLLDGKVAVVTGSGGGIGREHALALAKNGAKVLVNDLGGTRDGAGGGSAMADQVVKEIQEAGGEAAPNYDNVATMEGGQGILQSALDAFGKVDILVNNAGILRDKTFSKMTEDLWDSVVAVHLKGAFCVTQPIFNHMKERGEGGSIISTSSTSGLEGNFGQTNYGAAKAGIAGLTRCLAIEGLKAGIRANAIAPVALTRMTEDLAMFQKDEMKDRMDPGLVSPLIVYLASDLSKEITKKTFFIGAGTISEMRMTRTKGVTKTDNGGLWEPDEIAGKIDEILA
ncbi:MAG: SDR family NAD(P)-dependent oxidoreductase [Deltaproteobacteria bacterium]|nr:SDR family NAD(P)-dependent oxidoreductase [Deltaproteobacteria bacterium]